MHDQDVYLRQWARAERCARMLAGDRTTRGLVRALYALVVADEAAEPMDAERGAAAHGARRVLAQKRSAGARSVDAAPIQGSLW